MNFFTNKHVIIAMIVTPILAILSYTFVDSVVKEKPAASVPGSSYPLVAKSNCRYSSGQCDLVNGSLKINLSVKESNNAHQHLMLKANNDLYAVTVGFTNGEEQTLSEPISMQLGTIKTDNNEQVWKIILPEDTTIDTVLRIVIQARKSNYYAQTIMAFSEYKTSFNKKF